MTSAAPPAPAAPETTPVQAASQAAVQVDLGSSGPPPELGAAIATAANAYDQLAASGAHLHFALDPSTGRVTVEVHDPQGAVQSSISGADALRIANGEAFN